MCKWQSSVYRPRIHYAILRRSWHGLIGHVPLLAGRQTWLVGMGSDGVTNTRGKPDGA